MGAVSGNQLKAKTKRVQGVGNDAGTEITEAGAWLASFAEHGYEDAKTAYDAATPADKAKIDEILGGADSMQS